MEQFTEILLWVYILGFAVTLWMLADTEKLPEEVALDMKYPPQLVFVMDILSSVVVAAIWPGVFVYTLFLLWGRK